MWVLIALVLLKCFTSTQSSERADSIYSYLAAMSAYRFASNDDVNDVTYKESECPQKIWMFLRHGTRNPKLSEIVAMNLRLPEIKDIIVNVNNNGKSKLNDYQVNQFRKWMPLIQNVAYARFLSMEGKREHSEIAQRMRARFPSLFPAVFDHNTYRIIHTYNDRSYQSAKSFATGLFGQENVHDAYFSKPTYKDQRNIKFYEFCNKWKEQLKWNAVPYNETNLFEASFIVQEATAKVNTALGLVNKLSVKDVIIMYKTCAFESSWFRNISSPWCTAFDLDTIKVMAYAQDLQYYWVDGYGFQINYKQACPAIGDIINFFEDNTTNRKTTLYFTHSGSVIKFIAHLGLYYDDEPLLHYNFNPNRPKRWQISKIGNFASNVALILHDCGYSKKVSLRHNEYLIRLPACPDSDLCDFEVFKRYFYDSINRCNFEEMCGL